MSIQVRLAALALLAAAGALAAPPLARGPAGAAGGSTLDRPADPVVLTGAAVPSLAGIPPGDLVAFRYTTAWEQLPLQVDERKTVDFGQLYNSAPVGVTLLAYADAGTFTGADGDAALDADDEIVFMAKDAGGQAGAFSEPAGVVHNSGVEVLVADPLAPGDAGYVYLFRRSGALDPGAGQQYVAYTFNLLSGDYKTTYGLLAGPNPEDTTVTSPYYAHHFSDRWIDDELRVYAGGASGADILDRHKALFAPGNCVRSEDTFSAGEGAFIVNKSGPVRALRSYVGANSGPLTQREHVFYERRQELRTFLRVHAISGVMDFFDYAPAASGMTYANNLNAAGVAVDGVPETIAAGLLQWELVAGAQGSVVIAHSLSTDLALSPTSYYLDDSTPPVTQCTGDAFAYASSGPWINQAIACTDPDLGCANYLNATRNLYYEAPGAVAADAQARYAQASSALTFTVAPWTIADADGDGIDDAADNCPSVANAPQDDGDADLLGDACEASVYGTDALLADTDGDNCRDGREARVLTFAPAQGGDRDALSQWDFFDAPAPALTAAAPSGARSGAVTLADVSAVLFYVGTVDGGAANANGADYDTDYNANATDDGLEYDRTPSGVTGKPWRSGAPSGAVTLQDASVALAQVGHNCNAPP